MMDDKELHYLSYDPDEIWSEMITAYVNAGGDILYPGDEKEILLRGVLAVVTQVFAGVDNALRMQTLRYAVDDYLDVLGEQRNCTRITASYATTTVQITFQASGQAKKIPAGTAMTADGIMFYALREDVEQTGYAQVVNATILCTQAGSAGNGLLNSTPMQLAVINTAVTSIVVLQDAKGGNEREDNDTYRERIRMYGLSSVTTGPASQYESVAMNVSSAILDAKAIHLGAGNVGVYLILQSSEGASAILESVEDALSSQDVRPITDHVEVLLANEIAYVLNVQYTSAPGAYILPALTEAVNAYKVWQENTVGRPFNPDRLIAMLYQAGATRVVFGEGSHFGEEAVQYTVIDDDTRCKGEITLAVMET